MPAAVHKRALHRAIDMCGGVEPLAERLGVSDTALRFWLNTSGPLPDDIFLKVVDLLLERTPDELPPRRGGDAPHTPHG